MYLLVLMISIVRALSDTVNSQSIFLNINRNIITGEVAVHLRSLRF